MNPIEQLRDDLAGRFPGLPLELDGPAGGDGPWFLDVPRGEGLPPVIVEWRPGRGFGVSTPDGEDYGAGPDEVYPDGRAALDRTVRLILSGGRSEPPRAARLGELRRSRGLSQAELAGRAGVKQANIARIESRGDLKVSTLARVVAAMGARLVIRAHFPDGVERELTI